MHSVRLVSELKVQVLQLVGNAANNCKKMINIAGTRWQHTHIYIKCNLYCRANVPSLICIPSISLSSVDKTVTIT